MEQLSGLLVGRDGKSENRELACWVEVRERPTLYSERINQTRALRKEPAPSVAEGMGHPQFRERQMEREKGGPPAPCLAYGLKPCTTGCRSHQKPAGPAATETCLGLNMALAPHEACFLWLGLRPSA